MNKRDLVAKVAKDTGLNKVHAEATVDSFLDGLAKALKKHGSVTLVGFGSFRTVTRDPRKSLVAFSAGRALKQALINR